MNRKSRNFLNLKKRITHKSKINLRKSKKSKNYRKRLSRKTKSRVKVGGQNIRSIRNRRSRRGNKRGGQNSTKVIGNQMLEQKEMNNQHNLNLVERECGDSWSECKEPKLNCLFTGNESENVCLSKNSQNNYYFDRKTFCKTTKGFLGLNKKKRCEIPIALGYNGILRYQTNKSYQKTKKNPGFIMDKEIDIRNIIEIIIDKTYKKMIIVMQHSNKQIEFHYKDENKAILFKNKFDKLKDAIKRTDELLNNKRK